MKVEELVEKFKGNFEIGKEYTIKNLKIKGNEATDYIVIRTNVRFLFFTNNELIVPTERPFKNIEDLEVDHNITVFESFCDFFDFNKE